MPHYFMVIQLSFVADLKLCDFLKVLFDIKDSRYGTIDEDRTLGGRRNSDRVHMHSNNWLSRTEIE